MASPNQPVGPTLGAGFTGGGSFTDIFGNVRSNNFAVDIVTTPALVAQVITFGALSNHGLGTGPVALTATSSSGLPISFSSNSASVCTVSGSNVTLVSLGTCSLPASQPGNSSYAAATSVTQTFTVYTAPSSVIEVPASNATLSKTTLISGWALENTTVVGPNSVRSVAVLIQRVHKSEQQVTDCLGPIFVLHTQGVWVALTWAGPIT